MMRRIGQLCAGFSMMLLMAASVSASPFDRELVAADAKWIMHVDVDAGRESKIWLLFRAMVMDWPDVQRRVDRLETVTNSQMPDALHGITLYSTSFWPQECVVIVHASIDRPHVEKYLDAEKQAAGSEYHDRKVRTWQDRGASLYASFAADDRVVVGRTQESLQLALDVIDNRAPSLPADSKLAGGIEPGALIYIAGTELSALKEQQMARSPLLDQTDTAWTSLTESNGEAIVKTRLQTKNEAISEQVKKAAEGLAAMAALSGDSGSTDPRQRALAVLMRDITVVQEKNVVNIDWRIPLVELHDVIEKAPTTGQTN